MGLVIRCYGDMEECGYFLDGTCTRFDRPCAGICAGQAVPDGDGEDK